MSSLGKMVSILRAGCFSGASVDLKISSLATTCLFQASLIFMLSSINDWHPDTNKFLAKMVRSIFPAVLYVMHIIVLAWLDMDGASDVELASSSSIIPSHGWPTFQFDLNAPFHLLISYNHCIFSIHFLAGW